MSKNSMEVQGQQGKIKIASDVIMVITKKAVEEVKGIISFSGGISKGVVDTTNRKNNPRKGVNVENEEKQVVINLSVAIEYGVVIPDVIKEVQQKVKSAIETMTEITVEKVNVYVQDIKIS
ncbi:Asp23/Gls24 family envelope stress response protein [Alkaliphilus serpentinus]|nr:Asp23/Gls24 family envelope stress response protein [Alkaliphilus serpentinus]